MYQVNFLPRRQRRDRRRAYFWLGVLLLQVMALLLALFSVAGQLRHQQTQRQARLAMLGEELTALTSLARQQQQERAQQAMHSARAERQANNAQHNRRYLQLLQQLSSSIPPPLWLTALDSNAANGLRLRGLSRSPAPSRSSNGGWQGCLRCHGCIWRRWRNAKTACTPFIWRCSGA